MILAFGCSVTHGTETATVNASDENVYYSYPSVIARYLKVECENWAFQGNSNENIFYDFMEIVPQRKNITAVIVGWTSPLREVWKCEGRYWQFIPSWCATVEDLTKPFGYFKDPANRWDISTPRQCSDREEYIGILDQEYKFLTKYKWDENEYKKKRMNYILAVRTYCEHNNIKLIETTWYDRVKEVDVHLTDFIEPWLERGVHPSKEDHIVIADYLIKHYKL